MKSLAFCLFFFFALMFFSCNQASDVDYPIIVTGLATEIDSSGVTFSAKVLGDRPDHGLKYGFVWGTKSNPVIDGSDKYIIHDLPDDGVISRHVSTTFSEGIKYYVRAFLQNKDHIFYGQTVSFVSLGSKAPKITGFTPDKANLSDTILIFGDHFSYIKEKNVVHFGECLSQVIEATQDTLWVLVPEKLNVSPAGISVSILNNIAVCSEAFNVLYPTLTDFNLKAGTYGSVVTITGKDFLISRKSMHVYFGRFKADIIQFHDESLQVIVPDSMNTKSCSITVRVNNKNDSFTTPFQLNPMTVTDFNPKTAKTGATITFTGSNFCPLKSNNSVIIGGLAANILSVTPNELKVVLPGQDAGYYESRTASVKLEVAEEKQTCNSPLVINDIWFRLRNIPDDVMPGINLGNKPVCFSANNKGYAGLDFNHIFWQFDPLNQSWTRMADFPGTKRTETAGFVIGKNIFMGTGCANQMDSIPGEWAFRDWWRFDTENNLWTPLKNVPFGFRYGAVAFTVNNTGYFGTGMNGGFFSDIWKYDSSGDNWTKVTDYVWGTGKEGMYRGVAVATADVAYIGLGSTDHQNPTIFKYTPAVNTWKRLPDFPQASYECYPQGFSLNGRVYIKTVGSPVYYYDEVSSGWVNQEPERFSAYGTLIIFTIGNKAYIGQSSNNHMWEFDPTR